MAANLETIASNFGKGFLSGAITIADPLGAIISDADYYITGVGPCDKERSLPTAYNKAYQRIYKKTNDKIGFSHGYVPRFLGSVTGGLVSATCLAGLYYTGGLLFALAIPVATGIYSGIGSFIKYADNMLRGEKIKDKQEKAGFFTGLSLGYHEYTHLSLFRRTHLLESGLSGRNLGESHLYSSIRESAKTMRRNFGAVAGYFTGAIIGGAISLLTLGLVPIYKSLRDTYYNVTEVPKKA